MVDFQNFNPDRFAYAVEEASRGSAGIGTYNERSLHAVLKKYIEPDETFHEVPVGRFVADIARDNEIAEIQTSQVFRMREKLEHFLEYSHVTLVCPQILRHYITKYDFETGKALYTRLSTKRGTKQDICQALIPIADMIGHENLALWIPFFDVTDLRPKMENRRRGKKTDTMPKTLVDEMYVTHPRDFLRLLPEGLPAIFTVKDVEELAQCSHYGAQGLCHLLTEMGLAARERRDKGAYYYTLIFESASQSSDGL